MRRPCVIIGATLLAVLFFLQPATAWGISANLSDKPEDYAVSRDDANGIVYLYGKLQPVGILNVPVTKGTPLKDLPGNPCGDYATKNIQLNITNTVVTYHSTEESAWTTSENKKVQVPGTCLDIGYCAFKCEYMMGTIRDTLTYKTTDHCDALGYCHAPASVYNFKFYDSSKDVQAPFAASPPFPQELDSSPDKDSDGVPDAVDNCAQPNPEQFDMDHDGRGDVCQDIDKDGVPDGVDNCFNAKNPDQKDSDGDRLGDACPQGEWPSLPQQEPPAGNEPTEPAIPQTPEPVAANEPTEPTEPTAPTVPQGVEPAAGAGGISGAGGDSDQSTREFIFKTFDESGGPCQLSAVSNSNPIGLLYLALAMLPLLRRRIK